MTTSTIAITGSSGLIGQALTTRLRAHGHTVVPVVRRDPQRGEVRWDPVAGAMDPAALDGVDKVVHLAGAGIGDKRWTASYKREVLESRTLGTGLIARTIAASASKPALLSGSAIGYYGASETTTFTEESTAGDTFLADVCVQWEQAADPAREAGGRVAHLRTGIVLTPRGGALKKMLPLYKLGVGGPFGNGRQWQSWISLDDEVAAIEHLLTSTVTGPVNLTAPNPVTNAELAKALGRALHRPAFLPVPRFAPALLLGGELADALLFTGQKVIPTVLTADGFTFTHPTLDGALASLLRRPA